MPKGGYFKYNCNQIQLWALFFTMWIVSLEDDRMKGGMRNTWKGGKPFTYFPLQCALKLWWQAYQALMLWNDFTHLVCTPTPAQHKLFPQCNYQFFLLTCIFIVFSLAFLSEHLFTPNTLCYGVASNNGLPSLRYFSHLLLLLALKWVALYNKLHKKVWWNLCK